MEITSFSLLLLFFSLNAIERQVFITSSVTLLFCNLTIKHFVLNIVVMYNFLHLAIKRFYAFLQYYEMSYGLNVEMHKQTEICKRLDAIIRQVLPFLSAEVMYLLLF